MAQHFDLDFIEPEDKGSKALIRIRERIKKRFEKGNLKISRRPIRRFKKEEEEFYQMEKGEKVYGVQYKVPYDKVVYKQDEAFFEIHKKGDRLKIFLVA